MADEPSYVTPAIRLDESGMWVLRKYHEAEVRRLRGVLEEYITELRDVNAESAKRWHEVEELKEALAEEQLALVRADGPDWPSDVPPPVAKR